MRLHAELLARAAAYEAEVVAVASGWRREREDRWEGVRARVESLTTQLRVAVDEARVADVGGTPREQVRDAMRRLVRFDRERQGLEDQVWGQLRAVRDDDARRRGEMRRKLAELADLGRRLSRELEHALSEATAGGMARIGDTAAGGALARELGRARAQLGQRLDALGANVEAELARVAGRGFPDAGEVLRRFDEAMAGRLGGGAPVRLLPVARRVPSGPPRKKAKVPKFLLGKFYRAGGLRMAGDSVEVTFTNPLAFCIVQGGDAVVVDGRPVPKEETFLDNGERRVSGLELSGASYLKFPKGGEIRVTLRGLALSPGQHRLRCSLELRKMGWVELDVTDEMR